MNSFIIKFCHQSAVFVLFCIAVAPSSGQLITPQGEKDVTASVIYHVVIISF